MKVLSFSSPLIICLLCSFAALAQRRDVVVVKKKPHRNIVYVNPSPKVRVVRLVPPEARIIHFRSVPYYFHAGLYYNFIGGRYVVVAAPRGMRVNILPSNYFFFNLEVFLSIILKESIIPKKVKSMKLLHPLLVLLYQNCPMKLKKLRLKVKFSTNMTIPFTSSQKPIKGFNMK